MWNSINDIPQRSTAADASISKSEMQHSKYVGGNEKINLLLPAQFVYYMAEAGLNLKWNRTPTKSGTFVNFSNQTVMLV